jgi:tetratricopeptide (TPR) repeat protein
MHLLDKINEARTFMGTSRALEARPLLEEVLQEDPNNPQAARLLGDCFFCLGELDEAIEVYTSHLAIFPEDQDARIHMAHAHAIAKEYNESIAILKEILDEYPQLKQAGDLYPRVLVQANRLEEALGFLKRGIAEYPDDPNVYIRYALFELSRGETNKSRRHAAKAIELDPENAEAHAVLGEMLHIQGVRDKSMRKSSADDFLRMARDHFETALKSDPLESIAAFRMASWHHENGRYKEARDLFQAALIRRPNWPEAHARMADVLWSLEVYRDSLQHYWIANNLGFNNPGFLLNYGLALANVGKKEAAIAIMKKALSLNPPPELTQKLENTIELLEQE